MTRALMAAALAAVIGASAWAGPIRAGVAKRTITPSEPGQFLAGYSPNRPAETVHDDLWVRALALSDGETTLVLAVCDLLGFMYPDALEMRQSVQGVPKENVILACTHVHSAPDCIGLWGPNPTKTGVDPKYLAFVKQRVGECLNEAVAAMQPARIGFAITHAPERTAHNTNVASVIDPAIDLLVVDDAEGKRLATLVNWACHPEVLSTPSKAVTSDLCHYLREEVEGRVGGMAMHFNGALGGMVTPMDESETFAEAERIGRAVGAAAADATRDMKMTDQTVLRVASKTFDVPIKNPLFQLAFGLDVIARPSASTDRVTTEVEAFCIGPAQFATCPGEALPTVGFAAKGMMTGRPTFFIGLAQDELGYIMPPEYCDLKLYEYERSMSIGPDIAPAVLGALAELLPEVSPPGA